MRSLDRFVRLKLTTLSQGRQQDVSLDLAIEGRGGDSVPKGGPHLWFRRVWCASHLRRR